MLPLIKCELCCWYCCCYCCCCWNDTKRNETAKPNGYITMMGKTVRLKYNSQYTSLETAQHHKNSMGKWCFRMMLNSSMVAHVLGNGEFELVCGIRAFWQLWFETFWSKLIPKQRTNLFTNPIILRQTKSFASWISPNSLNAQLQRAAVHIQLWIGESSTICRFCFGPPFKCLSFDFDLQ